MSSIMASLGLIPRAVSDSSSQAALPLYTFSTSNTFDPALGAAGHDSTETRASGERHERSHVRRRLLAIVANNQNVRSLPIDYQKNTPDVASHIFEVPCKVRAVVADTGLLKGYDLSVSVAFSDNHLLYVTFAGAADEPPINRVIRWLAEPSKRATALCLSDSGEVLSVVTLDGTLYLISVVDLLHQEQPRLFPGHFTNAGFPSLASFAKTKLEQAGVLNKSAPSTTVAPADVEIVEIALFSQLPGAMAANSSPNMQSAMASVGAAAPNASALIAIGLDRATVDAVYPNPADRPTVLTVGSASATGIIENVTSMRWWRPARSVIMEEISLRMGGVGTRTPSKRFATDALSGLDLATFDRYLLLGHASGRFSIFDVTHDVRSIVWTAYLDPTMPIKSIAVFAELAPLREAGVWSLQAASQWAEEDDVSTAPRTADASTDEPARPRAHTSALPLSVEIPECFAIVASTSAFYRLVLEQSVSSTQDSKPTAYTPYTETLLDSTSQLITSLADHSAYLDRFTPATVSTANTICTFFKQVAPAVSGGMHNSGAVLSLALTHAAGHTREQLTTLIREGAAIVSSDIVCASLAIKDASICAEFLPTDVAKRWARGNVGMLSADNSAESDTTHAATTAAPSQAGIRGFFSSIFKMGAGSEPRSVSGADSSRMDVAASTARLLEEGYRMLFPFKLYPQALMPSRLTNRPWRTLMQPQIASRQPLVSLLRLGDDKFRVFDPSLGAGRLLPLMEMLLPTGSGTTNFCVARNCYSSLLSRLKANGRNYALDEEGRLVALSGRSAAGDVADPSASNLSLREVLDSLAKVTQKSGLASQLAGSSYAGHIQRRAANLTSETSSIGSLDDSKANGYRRDSQTAYRKPTASSKRSAARKRYGSSSRIAVRRNLSIMPLKALPTTTSPVITHSPTRDITEIIVVEATHIIYTDKLIFIAENPRYVSNKMLGAQQASQTPAPQSTIADTAAPPTAPDRDEDTAQAADRQRRTSVSPAAALQDGSAASSLFEESPMMTGRFAHTDQVPSSNLPPTQHSPDKPAGATTANAPEDDLAFSDDEDLGTTAPNTLNFSSYMERMQRPKSKRFVGSDSKTVTDSFTAAPAAMPDPTFMDTRGQYLHQLDGHSDASRPGRHALGVSFRPGASSKRVAPPTVVEEENEEDGDNMQFGTEAIQATAQASELSALLHRSTSAEDVTSAQAVRKRTMSSESSRPTSPTASVDSSVVDLEDPAAVTLQPASVYIVSVNVATRCFRHAESLEKLMSKLSKIEAIPPELYGSWPQPEQLELPTTAILQRFELAPGEVILKFAAHRVNSRDDDVSNNAQTQQPYRLQVCTTHGTHICHPNEIKEPSAIVRRAILDADLGDYSFGAASGAEPRVGDFSAGLAGFDEDALLALSFRALQEGQHMYTVESAVPKVLSSLPAPVAENLRSKVATADRVSFALGLDSARIFEEMADGATLAVMSLGASGALAETHPLFSVKTGTVDMNAMSVTDIRAAAAAIVAGGSLQRSLPFAAGNAGATALLQTILRSRLDVSVQPVAKSVISKDVIPSSVAHPEFFNAQHGDGDMQLLQHGYVHTPPLAMFVSHPLVTALLLRAYALYTLSNVPVTKPLLWLTKAGRSDLAVAFAAGALNFPYLYPCVARGLAPPLPPPLLAQRGQLAPSERPKVANLLIQCQMLCWPARTRFIPAGWEGRTQMEHGPILLDTHAYSYAMSPSDFCRWVATNTDYSIDRAITWLLASGLVLEALLAAYERDKAANNIPGKADASMDMLSSAMHTALSRAVLLGPAVITSDAKILTFLAERGYAEMLAQFGDGVYLKALDANNLSRFLLSTQPLSMQIKLIASLVPFHLVPAIECLSDEALLAWLDAMVSTDFSDKTSGLLYKIQTAANLFQYKTAVGLAAKICGPLDSEPRPPSAEFLASYGTAAVSSADIARLCFKADDEEDTSLASYLTSAEEANAASEAAEVDLQVSVTPQNAHAISDFFVLCCVSLRMRTLQSTHTSTHQHTQALSWKDTLAMSRRRRVEYLWRNDAFVNAVLCAYKQWCRPSNIIAWLLQHNGFDLAASMCSIHGDAASSFLLLLHHALQSSHELPASAVVERVWLAYCSAKNGSNVQHNAKNESDVRCNAGLLRHILVALQGVSPDITTEFYATLHTYFTTATPVHVADSIHDFQRAVAMAFFADEKLPSSAFTSFSLSDLQESLASNTCAPPKELLLEALQVHLNASSDPVAQREAWAAAASEAIESLECAFPIAQYVETPTASMEDYFAHITRDISAAVLSDVVVEEAPIADPDVISVLREAVERQVANTFSRSSRDTAVVFSCSHVVTRGALHQRWLPQLQRRLCPDVDVSGATTDVWLNKLATAAARSSNNNKNNSSSLNTGDDHMRSLPYTYAVLVEEYASRRPLVVCPECLLRSLPE